MNTRKVILIWGLLLCCLFFPSVQAYAEGNQSIDTEQLEEFREDISDGIDDTLDGDVKKVLEENDISLDNPQGINKISVGSVIGNVFSGFIDALRSPLIMLGKLLAITVLCVVAQSIAPDGSSVTGVFKIAGILATITIMYDTIYANIGAVEASLQQLSEFMISYIPIFSSITAIGGSITSSGSYYAITLIVCEIVALIASKVIMPFLSIILAISLVSAINPNLQFGGSAESIKKACQWILGGLTTIFVGLLTIQGMTGTATDSIITRTAKFAASSFIPIIGGAVSEAYSTVYSSLGVIRTSVGTIGIIAILIMVLQPVITIIATKFVVSLAQIISGLFNQQECCDFFKSTNAVLSIALSVVICFSLIFIISTAVLMLMAMNISI